MCGDGCWGNFFSLLCFSFSHLLVIVYSFFTLRYFVYYAPLLCAVCKFRYSLLPRPYFIASFYGAISVTTFVEVGSFFGGPDHQPCLPQHLVSSFVFIVFSFISFCSRLKVVFCIVIIIFSLFVGIYFSLWFGNSKTFADCERVVFGIGPCPFILHGIGPCPFNGLIHLTRKETILTQNELDNFKLVPSNVIYVIDTEIYPRKKAHVKLVR